MNNDVIEVAPIEDSDFETYIREGERAALALPNRGPMRFDDEGNVHPEILAGFDEYGFYVPNHPTLTDEEIKFVSNIINKEL